MRRFYSETIVPYYYFFRILFVLDSMLFGIWVETHERQIIRAWEWVVAILSAILVSMVLLHLLGIL